MLRVTARNRRPPRTANPSRFAALRKHLRQAGTVTFAGIVPCCGRGPIRGPVLERRCAGNHAGCKFTIALSLRIH